MKKERNVPFFSIIIPTYNRADKLRRALESVRQQTFNNFEVIVCDDGSTDNTEQVAKDFSSSLNLRYIHEENWGGPARPRNNGIKLARGEWICFLDADDFWYPRKLESIKKYTPYADVVHHDSDIMTAGGKICGKAKGRRFKPPVFIDLMTNGNGVLNSSACVKKEIIEKVNGFTELKELIALEDYDLWLRVSRMSERFLYLPRSLGVYVISEDKINEFSDLYVSKLSGLFDRFKGFLKKEQEKQSKLFLFYVSGRVKLKNREFRGARSYLLKSVFASSSTIRIKSLISLVIVFMKSLGE